MFSKERNRTLMPTTMEMLAEVGIQPELSCLATTPADLMWMVKSGYGLALIDEQMTLSPELIAKPVANVAWTADTAFVHHRDSTHLALPIVGRHLRKTTAKRPVKNLDLRRKDVKQLPLELHS